MRALGKVEYLLWATILADALFSFFLVWVSFLEGAWAFWIFLALGILSLLLLGALLKSRDIGLTQIIELFALSTNAGWYVYLGIPTIINIPYRKPYASDYVYLSLGFLNLVCFFLSLILLLRSRVMFIRRTRSVQTDRL